MKTLFNTMPIKVFRSIRINKLQGTLAREIENFTDSKEKYFLQGFC